MHRIYLHHRIEFHRFYHNCNVGPAWLHGDVSSLPLIPIFSSGQRLVSQTLAEKDCVDFINTPIIPAPTIASPLSPSLSATVGIIRPARY
jgi:hypothetical protein